MKAELMSQWSVATSVARWVKRVMPGVGGVVKRIDTALRIASLTAAIREQGFQALYDRLEAIVPDISAQYSMVALDSEFLRLNVRAMHAFQMSLVDRALQLPRDPGPLLRTVVDIGDSAGTHVRYLRGLFPDQSFRCVSANLDEKAVERIRAAGLEAVCARAEALMALGIDADVFLSFETLEHLSAPIDFLRDLSRHSRCQALVITVPYVARSRMGLHHIRDGRREPVTPENTHVFELSPEDWTLLAQHAGWSVRYQQVYRQYPATGVLRLMKWWWRQQDFEGFWGAILVRDQRWSDQYSGS